ncbi:Sm-like ribonucleo protein [Linderina pennispora]|uniref:Sm protein B n=1 Tax=Linderina pennispora TaxID=61395 RepID=A0A1Y1WFB2_9FUNG|nr:Sm-like ribonucleoprotein [Linderina pennispora]ORX72203.1 Sm-like ribonucleo protein [Linderina pennispora]
MTIAKNSRMMSLLNYRLRLTLADTRVMTGQMLAFDKHMNLVLGDCEEFRTVKSKSSKGKTQQIKRTLGLVILRGESVISISVDGAPPRTDALKTRAAMATGPGRGLGQAGRGMPVAPPGMAPQGLAGPGQGRGRSGDWRYAGTAGCVWSAATAASGDGCAGYAAARIPAATGHAASWVPAAAGHAWYANGWDTATRLPAAAAAWIPSASAWSPATAWTAGPVKPNTFMISVFQYTTFTDTCTWGCS